MRNRTATRLLKASASELNAMVERFDAMLGEVEAFDDFESTGLTVANELVRRVLERRLQRTAERFGDEVRVGGNRYRRHESATATYHSLCGQLRVTRATYRLCGVHNGPTIVPLELSEGLVEDSSPALAFSVAQGYARMPSRDLEEEFQAAHRCLPSRSKLERMAKRIGGLAKRARAEIETVARRTETVPAGACSISIGMDRTAVPMIEERPPTQPPSTKRKRRTKPYVRRRPDPFDVVYRMAYAATASVHDVDGKVIRTIRFAATAEEGPDEMAESLGAEVAHLRRQAPTLPLVVVQDGAPELWGVVGEALAQRGLRPDYQMIDRYHVDERLAKIADILVPPSERNTVVHEWQAALDRDDRAMSRIVRLVDHELMAAHEKAGTVAHSPCRRRVKYGRYLGKAARSELTSHLGYLDGNRHLMRYATARRRGLPIGSGPTEGACKSVVGARVKRSGSRWYQDGLSACLTLRALLLSERLRASWPVLRSHYTARVTAA
jgi:hypothetical protein